MTSPLSEIRDLKLEKRSFPKRGDHYFLSGNVPTDYGSSLRCYGELALDACFDTDRSMMGSSCDLRPGWARYCRPPMLSNDFHCKDGKVELRGTKLVYQTRMEQSSGVGSWLPAFGFLESAARQVTGERYAWQERTIDLNDHVKATKGYLEFWVPKHNFNGENVGKWIADHASHSAGRAHGGFAPGIAMLTAAAEADAKQWEAEQQKALWANVREDGEYVVRRGATKKATTA